MVVAFTAGVFGNPAIISLDKYGVRIIAGGKGERVPKTIVRLGGILAEKILWSVTIVAGGKSVVG